MKPRASFYIVVVVYIILVFASSEIQCGVSLSSEGPKTKKSRIARTLKKTIPGLKTTESSPLPCYQSLKSSYKHQQKQLNGINDIQMFLTHLKSNSEIKCKEERLYKETRSLFEERLSSDFILNRIASSCLISMMGIYKRVSGRESVHVNSLSQEEIEMTKKSLVIVGKNCSKIYN